MRDRLKENPPHLRYHNIMRQMIKATFLNLYAIIIVGETKILPTIIWDRTNPIFKCDQKIFANIGDILEFRCPEENIRFHTPRHIPQQKKMEKIKFVGNDRQLYQNCDSSTAKTIFRCDNNNKNKHFTLRLRAVTVSENEIVFEPGKLTIF